MAHVKDIFGTGISGKLNQVVFYQRNGKTFVRALPVRHNLSVSPAQQLNRQRFAAMMRFARLFRQEVIPRIWNQASRTLTGKQLFVKTNKVAFDAQGNLTDPMKVQLSTGRLHLPQDIKLARKEGEPATLSVSWFPDFEGGSLSKWDELMVIAYGEGQYSDILSTGIRRGDQGGSFHLPVLEAAISHLYLFFGALDKRHYSGSLCLEMVDGLSVH